MFHVLCCIGNKGLGIPLFGRCGLAECKDIIIAHKGWSGNVWDWHSKATLEKYLEMLQEMLCDKDYPIYLTIKEVLGLDNAYNIASKAKGRPAFRTPIKNTQQKNSKNSSDREGMDFFDDLYLFH